MHHRRVLFRVVHQMFSRILQDCDADTKSPLRKKKLEKDNWNDAKCTKNVTEQDTCKFRTEKQKKLTQDY